MPDLVVVNSLLGLLQTTCDATLFHGKAGYLSSLDSFPLIQVVLVVASVTCSGRTANVSSKVGMEWWITS